MSWQHSHGTVRCLAVGCQTTIGDGEAYYQNRYGMAYCRPCALKVFQVDPPAVVEDAPAEKLALPPALEKFNRPAMVKEINKRMRDWRTRQAGEQD